MGQSKALAQVEHALRMGFVQKVYGILFVQLLITFGFTAFCALYEPMPGWIQQNTGIYYAALIASIVLIIAIVCCGNLGRSYPTNYILLFGFTIAESIVIGFSIAFYEDARIVFVAMGVTAGVVLGLTLFACQTSIDFTGMGGYLFAALWGLILYGFIAAVFCRNFDTAYTIYAGIGVVIFSLYLVYDTQLIIGGSHKKYQFSLDDYVFAALNLYLDIINLFLFILELLNRRG